MMCATVRSVRSARCEKVINARISFCAIVYRHQHDRGWNGQSANSLEASRRIQVWSSWIRLAINHTTSSHVEKVKILKIFMMDWKSKNTKSIRHCTIKGCFSDVEWSIKNPLLGYLLARYEESMAQLSRNILILDDCAKYYIFVVELHHSLQPTKKAQFGEKFEKNVIQCDATATTICLSGVD